MNVSHIQSCHAAAAPRAWASPAYRGDSSRGPDRCGDAYCPSWGHDGGNQPVKFESPVQPPWKVLPWPQPCRPVYHRPVIAGATVMTPLGAADVNSTGRTLDLFV